MDDTSCNRGISSYSLGVVFCTMREVKQYKRKVMDSSSSKKENLPGFDPEQCNVTLKFNLTLQLYFDQTAESLKKIPSNQNYSVNVLVHLHYISSDSYGQSSPLRSLKYTFS